MSHILFGFFAIGLGLTGVFVWWSDFGQVLRGFIPLGLILVGLVAMGAGLVPLSQGDPQGPQEKIQS